MRNVLGKTGAKLEPKSKSELRGSVRMMTSRHVSVRRFVNNCDAHIAQNTTCNNFVVFLSSIYLSPFRFCLSVSYWILLYH